MVYRDEIITEVWRNRDAYAARHHYSLDEMVADLQERQKRPNCQLVDRRDIGHKEILRTTKIQHPQA
jgi:hypothetical protein